MKTEGSCKRRLLLVVMDGVGLRDDDFGNAVKLAATPNMKFLAQNGLFTTLHAHGTFVGLPSDSDIGNSEVGHNALGAGRIFDQGAKIVQKAIESGSLYKDAVWQELVTFVKSHSGTLHFLGLLSDGNVHSHEQHLYGMLRQSKKEGLRRVRVHVLFDGRDVGEKSAEVYVDRLEKVMTELRSPEFDVRVASGGGRMNITMDRYEADWGMVDRGWKTHVQGQGQQFASLPDALKKFRQDPKLTDQYLPPFVIADKGQPVGKIADGDGVVFYNFRGDRGIEITKAFTEENFKHFDRGHRPEVYYAGMMEYDGDKHIPKHYLVRPPAISDTLGEYLVKLGIRQFACSETQKFGHVTYFWNGNRTGYFDQKLEEYVEIRSDEGITFDLKPWMKAYEITEATIKRMCENTFDFGRINYANGDMVGHMGNLEAAIIAVETVDLMLGRLIATAKQTDMVLIVTADHGNSDEMFDAKSKDFPNWKDLPLDKRPKPKTSHTLNPVPFYLFDPRGFDNLELSKTTEPKTLSNVANTVLDVMGLPKKQNYLPSLLSETHAK